jgi:hypothetical protein
MQALETWRTDSKKRYAVASATELNSKSRYLKRLCGSDSSADESSVAEGLLPRLAIGLACACLISAAGWEAAR